MQIEIHNPELHRRLEESIARGQFQSVDEVLTKGLNALAESVSPMTRSIGPNARLSKASAKISAGPGCSEIHECLCRLSLRIWKMALRLTSWFDYTTDSPMNR